jgi:leucyl/phenylalanyl-tRNA---protein transferase
LIFLLAAADAAHSGAWMIGPIDPDLLLRAYASGVFPMADDRAANSVYWVEPKTRGVLPLGGFHLSRSLAKVLRSGRFASSVDSAFGDVLTLCAESADDRPNTWINTQIEQAVLQLHARGNAHSVEVWEDGVLVGGLYGIQLGAAFFGESMFSRATDASKVALAHLVARMRAGGFTLLDCQFITPHLASLGAVEISRRAYMVSLTSALSGAGSASAGADFFAFDRVLDDDVSPPRTTIVSGPVSGWRIVQALAQTS